MRNSEKIRTSKEHYEKNSKRILKKRRILSEEEDGTKGIEEEKKVNEIKNLLQEAGMHFLNLTKRQVAKSYVVILFQSRVV